MRELGHPQRPFYATSETWASPLNKSAWIRVAETGKREEGKWARLARLAGQNGLNFFLDLKLKKIPQIVVKI